MLPRLLVSTTFLKTPSTRIYACQRRQVELNRGKLISLLHSTYYLIYSYVHYCTRVLLHSSHFLTLMHSLAAFSLHNSSRHLSNIQQKKYAIFCSVNTAIMQPYNLVKIFPIIKGHHHLQFMLPYFKKCALLQFSNGKSSARIQQKIP